MKIQNGNNYIRGQYEEDYSFNKLKIRKKKKENLPKYEIDSSFLFKL